MSESNFISPGLYEYVRESGDHKKRLHLRIEPDGFGVLLINASSMYHFNPSATLMAHRLLEERDDADILRDLTKHFAVKRSQAAADLAQFKTDFTRIISPQDDVCPVCDFDVETFAPFSKKPSAPYRMDLALTYRCNNRCVHCYNETARAKKELDAEEWKQVLDQLWEIGIPHVVFTGGEPTIIPFLPDLIRYAEELGMITGLNTNGRKLSDPVFVETLVKSGLDHVQITLESHLEDVHDRITMAKGAWQETTQGIRNALKSRLFVMTNTTLLRSNCDFLEDTLRFLAEMGVPTVGLNGLIYSGRGVDVDESISEDELPDLLEIAKAHANKSGQRLIWYTPTMYCHFDPVESNLGVKGCTAALYNMCIEPDGSVLPCQSYYQSLGNFLTEEWPDIWEHPLAVSIRNREYAPESCHFCDLMDTCGAGCPLHLINNPEIKPKPVNALPF